MASHFALADDESMAFLPDLTFPPPAAQRDGEGNASARPHGSGEGTDGAATLERIREFETAGRRMRAVQDEASADLYFRQGLDLGLAAIDGQPRSTENSPELRLLVVRCAVECGEAELARALAQQANDDAPFAGSEEWKTLGDLGRWPDRWLVAAIRRAPPDQPALDELAQRHWRTLFGRCQMLTLNREAAADLAQDAWCKVLKAHRALKPGGNFPAYITTVATNLWRDGNRGQRRAGALGAPRLASLDDELPTDTGDSVSLGEVIPDLASLEGEERKHLMQDIDHALGQLPSLLRDVLISRFLDGESCAQIARRVGRTEQSVSGWVRRALQDLKTQLQGSRSDKREKSP
ncbi:hypothetical protein DB347_11800 [Opitutaceae bacterium EW11]|nr:hypothetical protein DB347_11800 [Opitutaceae bacterium EW11]